MRRRPPPIGVTMTETAADYKRMAEQDKKLQIPAPINIMDDPVLKRYQALIASAKALLVELGHADSDTCQEQT